MRSFSLHDLKTKDPSPIPLASFELIGSYCQIFSFCIQADFQFSFCHLVYSQKHLAFSRTVENDKIDLLWSFGGIYFKTRPLFFLIIIVSTANYNLLSLNAKSS